MEALYYIRSPARGLEFETDMRWFVEVSRVGENGVADEYCVEAKQWQAALQEARKLRGDTGALSKFSIELLDRGYRAVDPSLKLRYLINEAPADAPLTGSGESAKKNGNKPEHASRPRVGDSLAPSAYATSLAPTPFTTSLAPPATSSLVPRPVSHPAPRPTSLAPQRAASVEPPRASQLVVPDDPIPKAPPLPGSVAPAFEVPAPRLPQFELVRQRAEEPRPDSPITYREFAYAVEPGRSRDEIEALLRDRYQATLATIEDRPPGKFVQLAVFDHVFKRRPERPPLATFAWKDWRGEPVLAFPGFGEEAMGPMSRVPAARESVAPPSNGVAAASPSVAPASVPVVPMAPVVIASVPPPAKVVETSPPPTVEAAISKAELPKPAEAEIPILEEAPTKVVEATIPIVEEAPTKAVEATIPIVEEAPTKVDEATIPIVEEAPAQEIPIAEVPPAVSLEVTIPHVEAPAPAAEAAIPIVEGGRAPLVEGVSSSVAATHALPPEAKRAIIDGAEPPSVEVPVSIVEGSRPPVAAPIPPAQAAPAPNFELNFEAPPTPAAPTPAPSNERASRSRIAIEGRRRAGEDLIGELFEIMHELNFARDVAEGSEFVLSVLNELLPCEGVLIHVFDINTGYFVVVRAKGPQARGVLLQRMSDQDPLIRSVMRSTHAISVKNAGDDARFTGPRWQALGVLPRATLCGGVQINGRYLGLIEVANPHGDVPFHQSELHALDYICEQFADFLSKKPIVLSADVVLSHA